MKDLIYEIEVRIGEAIKNEYTPTVLLANNRAVEELIMFVYEDKPINWLEPITLAFADGEIPLRVYRTMDLKYNELLVI
jgi:hypothetical protein